MIREYENPICIKKGKTSVTFALGVGSYNPDDTVKRGLKKAPKYDVWIKYDGTWYFVTTTWKYDSLSDLVKDFKRDVYSEEQFLEKIFQFIE